METIRFSQLGKEDIRFGRGTFEVQLADGRAATLSELNLDHFDRIFSRELSNVSDNINLLTLRYTSTGTPAAGLGVRLTFEGESADEDPAGLGALEFAFDDVTAGSEDSTGYLYLRRAGAALSRAYGFRNTGDFNLLFSAALTAARTITIPDVTDTLVTLTSTQTLTNKTLTDSVHNAGGGSHTMRPSGIIDVNTTSAGTPASPSETDLITHTLVADTLSANGRALRVRAWGTTGANTNTKTVRLYFGSTVAASNDQTTTPNNLDWSLEYLVVRTGSSAQDIIGSGFTGTTLQSTSFNTATETDTGAITLKVTGENGTATANDIVAEGFIVEYLNGAS